MSSLIEKAILATALRKLSAFANPPLPEMPLSQAPQPAPVPQIGASQQAPQAPAAPQGIPPTAEVNQKLAEAPVKAQQILANQQQLGMPGTQTGVTQ